MYHSRSWTDVLQILGKHRCQPRLIYPEKLSVIIDGESKLLHDKGKFKDYLSINSAVQKLLEEKLQSMKVNYIKGRRLTTPMETKRINNLRSTKSEEGKYTHTNQTHQNKQQQWNNRNQKSFIIDVFQYEWSQFHNKKTD